MAYSTATAAPPGKRSDDAHLLRLRPRDLWRALRRQPLVFWFLCAYFVVEYLRPQAVYPGLDVLPWGQAAFALTLGALFFDGEGRGRPYLLDGLVAAFFFWVVISAAGAHDKAVAFNDWQTPLSWILLYVLTTQVVVTRTRAFLFFLAFLVINLKMSQHGARTFVGRGFAFADWGATGSPGWFQNSGEFGMQMAAILGLSACVAFGLRRHLPKWGFWAFLAVFPGTALLSVAASSSRGGQIAAAVVVLTLMLMTRVRVRSFVGVALVLLVGWALIPEQQKDRFDAMGEDETSVHRLTMWEDAWELTQEHPIAGIGYRNWPGYSMVHTSNRTGHRVHNSILQGSVELGFPGALLFLGACAAAFFQNARTRRLLRRGDPEWGRVMRWMAFGLDAALIGLLVGGFFMSVLFYPVYWTSFAMTVALAESARRGVERDRRAARSARPVWSEDRGVLRGLPAS